MGFMRGLSAAYMEATPAINDWLAGLIASDETFQAARFSIIRERAAIATTTASTRPPPPRAPRT